MTTLLSEHDLQRIADLVVERLLPRLATPAAELLTRDEIARALRVSPATIERRARKGMPVQYIGDLPRFDLAACRQWLADHEQQRTLPPSEDEGPLHVTMRSRPR